MDLPRYHRLRAAYHRLEGQRCAACAAIHFPPRPAGGRCRDCGGRELTPHRLAGRGTVDSFSELAQAPSGFEAPYVVALVRLAEGMLVTAQLTDVEARDVTIGLEVEMVTRRLQQVGDEGPVVYGFKFRPSVRRAPPR
jgi:uncharacterized protein